ncbi:hypothetical protein [Micromonospora sp. RL09-050-HVF-A]|uniref:hypothetical protein n=1 Tax=Micromonospora sp. RL09-050-HVF-A TaxID=1703433 RepID=UPI001C5EBE94|nr:hypothetical protein [Micromonospora sp. RL09-050-HVF-A]MBW4700670.1 hypothetical protein [Micromonospora sp. RL09-050-HVF-A]
MTTIPYTPLARYAARLHAELGDRHHVASPLGAWLLLALAAPAATGAVRAELAEVLGVDGEAAAATAAALLDHPHPLVPSATALWHRPGADTAKLAGWTDGLPRATASGPLPDQAGLDAWAREHTLGLIDRFPLTVSPRVLLALAGALATRISWATPFDLVPGAMLGPGAADLPGDERRPGAGPRPDQAHGRPGRGATPAPGTGRRGPPTGVPRTAGGPGGWPGRCAARNTGTGSGSRRPDRPVTSPCTPLRRWNATGPGCWCSRCSPTRRSPRPTCSPPATRWPARRWTGNRAGGRCSTCRWGWDRSGRCARSGSARPPATVGRNAGTRCCPAGRRGTNTT